MSRTAQEDLSVRKPNATFTGSAFSAFNATAEDQTYVNSVYETVQPLAMAKEIPPQFAAESKSDEWIEPTFDPAVHLDIAPPSSITLLDFTEVKQAPVIKNNTQSQLAYTSAFRLLSEEGVRVLREILARNQKHVRSCDRIPNYIRGLAYTSKFIRDFNESPDVLRLLSAFAGQRLLPHYLTMNYSHTNIGKTAAVAGVKNDVPVDKWHTDSVPFVLIIILSDLTDMVGGELQCVRCKGREAGFALIDETGNNVDEKDLLNVNYQKMGYGLFMQGSEIVHHVTPVQSAREARITMVNSYMPANCFAPDRTVYATFIQQGNEKEAVLEFARGRAWRAQQQLSALLETSSYTENPLPLADHLSRIVKELQMTVELLQQKASDEMHFYDENGQGSKFGQRRNSVQQKEDESKK